VTEMAQAPQPARRIHRARVLIADDHPLFVEGVAKVIATYPEMELVAKVTDARTALAEIRRLKPDVALVDLKLPDLDGITVVEQLEREGLTTRVAIVSAYEESATVYRAIAAGARAYLSKLCEPEALRTTIMALARGDTVIPPTLQTGLAREIRSRRDFGDAPVLTVREIEVLRLIAEGLSAPDIAKELVLGVTTIKTHMHNIYAKLEVSDRAAAVAQAIRRGILQ
jgi:two-component system, NarL family, nitrate/nitrite response regulator NarL